VFNVVPLGRVNWRGDCYHSYAMRYLCVLLILALSLPAATQARTVSVKVGKTTKLSPQQVQFMRWWRVQNIRVVKPAAKPAVKPIAQTKLTLKVVPRSVTGRTVKVVRINTNTRRQVRVPIDRTRKTATQRTRTPSLLTLKAILINAQASPAAGFSSDSGPKLTVRQVKRRVVRRTERSVTQRETKQQQTVSRAAKKLVIVQQRPVSTSPQPNTLTRLRYQLELAQME
jgi:hypothetical protein